MFATEFLLKLINKDNINRYILTLLFFSLITVLDIFTLYVFGTLIGIFLYMTIITLLSFLGVLIIISQYKKNIDKINKKHDIGIFPNTEFINITGLIICTFLLIFPGIVSSTIGYIFLIPYIRQFIGRITAKRLKLDWYAVYEYMEIYNK